MWHGEAFTPFGTEFVKARSLFDNNPGFNGLPTSFARISFFGTIGLEYMRRMCVGSQSGYE